MQERRQALALGIAALEELLTHRVVDVRILQNGLEVSLNACHRRLQLMRDVLRELTLEDVLFAACGLQTLVNLDDALRYLAQLVTRKDSEVFHVERLVMVSTRGKGAQLHDVVSEAVRKAIEDDGKQQNGAESEPYIMLVSLKRLRKVVVVRQGGADEEGVAREVSGGIEVVASQRLAVTVHSRACSMRNGIGYLRSCDVVRQVRIVLQAAVVRHLSVRAYDGYAKVGEVVRVHIMVELGFGPEIQETHRFLHVLVIVLQLQIERVNLELLFAFLLEDNERDGENQENGKHAQIELGSYRIFHKPIRQNNIRSQVL